MSLALRRLLWWVQDYAYAVIRQVGAAVSRTPPESFHSGERNPVVVIPGVFESWQFMLPMITGVHRAGHPVYVVPGMGRNRSDVRTAALIVADYLDTARLDDAVILAHSKGGLIGKYFMLTLDPEQRISRMIAICTPFSGSRYARYLIVPSLRIFSPRNALTLQMAKEEALNHRITSLYGVFDPHIPEGSILPGATNIQLPAAGHFRILGHRATLHTVLKLVEAASPPDPQNPNGQLNPPK